VPGIWPKSAAFLVLFAAIEAAGACSSGNLNIGTRDAVLSGNGGASGAGGASLGVQPTQRAASIPVGIENVNNSPLLAANYRALLRFVPDRALSIDRLYFGFNLQGASCQPDTATDGSGDGGVLDMSLVNIDLSTGLPSTAVGHESIAACTRYEEARTEAGSTPVLVWLNVIATLEAGKMYGLVVKNTHANPAANYFSFHMPIADAALAGPQARNELDANAPGAILSLDPREHVAWSEDAGKTWQYGANNGQYPSFIDPAAMTHPATRVPQYGFRRSSGSATSAQPYYAYSTNCSACRVVYANARYARSFTLLGGFIATSTDVGALTMTNLTTGVSASCTPDPGYGFRTCPLPTPVAVAVSESYSIAATGSVALMHMDNAQRVMFPAIGSAEGDLRAYQPDPAPGTNEKDVPSLWAGPLSANFPSGAEQ